MREHLKISLALWYRGNGPAESRLLREDGMMCCLGFYALLRGYEPEYVLGVASPRRLLEEIPDLENKFPDWVATDDRDRNGLAHNSYLIKELIRANDDERLTEEERMRQVRDLFNRANVEVEFVP